MACHEEYLKLSVNLSLRSLQLAQTQSRSFTCSVASLSDRTFTVERGADGWMARSRVGGNSNCSLKHIHVQMAFNSGWIPRVAYVDIYGVDLQSGELVHEKKIP